MVLSLGMKARILFRGFMPLFFLLLVIVLTICKADDANVPPTNETARLIPQNVSDEADSMQEKISPTIYFATSTENIGGTSTNVRLHFEVSGLEQQQYNSYELLDLNQFSHYHILIQREDAMRILFTTETTVSDFKFFDVRINDAVFGEDADETARRYIVQEILYSLSELTPEFPFVVQGPWFGSIFAEQGFSFSDEYGTTRYFVFGQSGKTGLIYITEF